MALNMVDLTTLEGMDTTNKVTQMLYKYNIYMMNSLDLPTVAAVCVYPNFVKIAVEALKDQN